MKYEALGNKIIIKIDMSELKKTTGNETFKDSAILNPFKDKDLLAESQRCSTGTIQGLGPLANLELSENLGHPLKVGDRVKFIQAGCRSLKDDGDEDKLDSLRVVVANDVYVRITEE